MRKCAVIPALNEEKYILGVIEEVKAQGIDPIVIDDGSTDNTYNIALDSGVCAIKHSKRQGKGSAIRTGLDFALKNNYDLIFTLDGDGQHHPKEMKRFLDSLEDNSIIIGNRMHHPKNMSIWRYLSNKLNSVVVSLVCGQSIPDSQCGYRLFTSRAIQSIVLEANNYEIELEMTVKLARKGFRIISVPIESIYESERSDICPIRDSWRVFVFLVKLMVR